MYGISGHFFDNQVANFGITTFTSAGSLDVFIAKYATSDGALVQVISYAGTNMDHCPGLAVDSTSGDAFIMIISNSAALTIGTHTLTNAGFIDTVVARQVGG